MSVSIFGVSFLSAITLQCLEFVSICTVTFCTFSLLKVLERPMQVLTGDPQHVVVDFGAHPLYVAAFHLNQQVALHQNKVNRKKVVRP